MLQIYDFKSTVELIQDRLEFYSSQRRLSRTQIIKDIGIHPTSFSQIVKKKRTISLPQALKFAKYLDFTEKEEEYFILLVQLEKATDEEVKDYYNTQIKNVADKMRGDISQNLKFERTLSEQEQSVYYSSWEYAAVRNVIVLPGLQHKETIAQRLNLPTTRVDEIISFLIKVGLCKLNEKNELIETPQSTHLNRKSPAIKHHHINWRLKNIEKVNKLGSNEFMYTALMSISEEDAKIIQNDINEFMKSLVKRASASKPEVVRSFCLDWTLL